MGLERLLLAEVAGEGWLWDLNPSLMTPRFLLLFPHHLTDICREGLCLGTLTQSGPLWWPGELPLGGAVVEGERDWSFLPSGQCLHPLGERTGKGTHLGR